MEFLRLEPYYCSSINQVYLLGLILDCLSLKEGNFKNNSCGEIYTNQFFEFLCMRIVL